MLGLIQSGDYVKVKKMMTKHIEKTKTNLLS